MKVLILDHHFSQDIESLKRAMPERTVLRTISPLYFAWRAQRYLPPKVFLIPGLEEYTRPEYSRHRERWARAARQALHEIYQIYPFDVFIAPSDTFFHVRDVVTACRELGVPFLIVQKETTRPAYFMEHTSRQVGRLFPFIGDFMTVCSERHKQFWLNADTPAAKIEVTGQPRFDFYQQPALWRSREDLGLPLDAGRKLLLFLSYFPDVYSAWIPDGRSLSWHDLRRETQEVLIEFAKTRSCDLLVKPHPQQNTEDIAEEAEFLARIAGNAWDKHVFLLPRNIDTRHLIVNADVIIGFQTTALLEAMAAGKETIYTRWSKELAKLEDRLIAFHEYSPALRCALSPEDLRKHVEEACASVPGSRNDRLLREAVEEHLGPVDGHASDRTWAIIARELAHYPPLTKEQQALRSLLAQERPKALEKARRDATRALAIWRALANVTPPVVSPLRRLRGKFAERVDRTKTRVAECDAAIRNEIPRHEFLVGWMPEQLLMRARYWLARRRLGHA